MALKKDGEKTYMSVVIKKSTVAKIEELAKKTNRPKGRMLDEIVESYKEKE